MRNIYLKTKMENIQKIGFIINPISGTRTKANIPNLIDCLIDKNKFEIDIRFTEYAGHAIEIATEMVNLGYNIVVSVGGDGTMNEIARTLVHKNTSLALIPCGSGNGLARHLGIPLLVKDAINMINNHKVVEIDYGTANEVKFFGTCGVGFDAYIGNEFAKSPERGFKTYFKSVFGEFFKYKSKKYKFTQGENRFKKRAFLVTFANASQYGNNAYIAPAANVQDGLIDVSILQPFPLYKIFSLGFKLMTKRIAKSRYVQLLQTEEISIKRKKKDIFHFDGEPCIMKKKIKIKAHKGGLKILVPANSPLN